MTTLIQSYNRARTLRTAVVTVSTLSVAGAAIFAMSSKPLSPTALVVMNAVSRGYKSCGVIALKARLSKSHAAMVLGRLYAAGRITRKQRDGNHGRYPAYDYAISSSLTNREAGQ